MALVDITPIMRSNTMPAPCVVRASSENSIYKAYRAFDGEVVGDNCGWVTAERDLVGSWIMIDFGRETKVTCARLYAYTWSGYLATMIDILGSNDGATFHSVIENIALNYPLVQSGSIYQDVTFANVITYRYIKVVIKGTASTRWTGFNEIRFLCDEKHLVTNLLSIHKTLKKNLPKIIGPSKDELHFTEDGGIHLSLSDGTFKQCNSGEIIKEISNPLTTQPLEYGFFSMGSGSVSIQELLKDTPVSFKQVTGNIIQDGIGIKLKKGNVYNISYSFTATSAAFVYDMFLKSVERSTDIHNITCTASTTSVNRTSSNSFSIIYECSQDEHITISYNQDLTFVKGIALSIQEIRNNPVNQYGGFESQVLFEGNANAAGEYQLADTISNYDFLIFESKSTNSNPITEYVLPPMTAVNLPRPLVVSHNGLYSGYSDFAAFNQRRADTYDCWCSISSYGWLAIDTGKNTECEGVFLSGRDYCSTSMKQWKVEGSYDGSTWNILVAETAPIPKNGKLYRFNNGSNYRYYKITGSASNDGNCILGNFDLVKIVTDALSTDLVASAADSTKAIDGGNTVLNVKDLKLNIISIIKPILKITGLKGQLPSLLSGGEF